MNLSKAAVAATLVLVSLTAQAGSATDKLSACLAENTTPKEKRDLAKWVFMAMGAHPDMQDISKISPAAREDGNKRTAEIITKLMTDTCVPQTRNAMSEGGNAFKDAFEVLGKLAMQELMTNPDVGKMTQEFTKYLDQKKFDAAFKSK